jgi:hypothetical protein
MEDKEAMESTDEYMQPPPVPSNADIGDSSHFPQPSGSSRRRQDQRMLATVYDAVAGKLRGSEMSLSRQSGK